MAPESNILRRKRSRPSDYWVVSADATAQRNGDALVSAEGKKEEGCGEVIGTAKSSGGRRVRSSGTAAELKVSGAGGVEVLPGAGKKHMPLQDKANRIQGDRGAKDSKKSKQSGGTGDLNQVVSFKVPRKRGRRSLSKSKPVEVGLDESELDQLAPVEVKRSRGRSSLSKSNPVQEVLIGEGYESSQSINTTAQIQDIALTAAVGVRKNSPRKRRRPVVVGPKGVDELAFQENGRALKINGERRTNEITKKKKQNRVVPASSKSGGQSSAVTGSARESTRSRKQFISISQRQAKPSEGIENNVIEVETASSKLTRGKPKTSTGSRPISRPNAPETSSAPQRTSEAEPSRRISGVVNYTSKKESSRKFDDNVKGSSKSEGRKRKEVEANVPAESNKRQRVDDEAQQDIELSERTPYPHLEPTIRRVSRLKIDKWEPLPLGCVDQISTLLHEVQKPVIARVEDDRKKSLASVALRSVSRKLVKKLSRGLPFPLATGRTREDEFDFEKILDNSRALESQLTPAIHANGLLEAELRKEMARLESDKQNLVDLEANSKSEAALRNDTSRSIHPLLHPGYSSEANSFQLDVGLEDKQIYQSLDTNVADENLQVLLKSLGSHMDSIQGNIKQVDGITESLARTRGAIQARLFDHLDTSQYEAVVLGSDA